ncbi:MAG: DUF4124 domain-containing protein [Pseudomonadota bacterium]
MRTPPFIFLFILLISIAYVDTGAAKKIYSWTDEHGNVHFGDKPLGGDAKTITVKPASIGDGASGSRLERTKKLIDSFAEDRKALEEKREKAETARKEAAKQCAAAEVELREIRDAQFLYEEGESGEKQVLSFEQRAQAERNAADKVRDLCGKK